MVHQLRYSLEDSIVEHLIQDLDEITLDTLLNGNFDDPDILARLLVERSYVAALKQNKDLWALIEFLKQNPGGNLELLSRQGVNVQDILQRLIPNVFIHDINRLHDPEASPAELKVDWPKLLFTWAYKLETLAAVASGDLQKQRLKQAGTLYGRGIEELTQEPPEKKTKDLLEKRFGKGILSRLAQLVPSLSLEAGFSADFDLASLEQQHQQHMMMTTLERPNSQNVFLELFRTMLLGRQ